MGVRIDPALLRARAPLHACVHCGPSLYRTIPSCPPAHVHVSLAMHDHTLRVVQEGLQFSGILIRLGDGVPGTLAGVHDDTPWTEKQSGAARRVTGMQMMKGRGLQRGEAGWESNPWGCGSGSRISEGALVLPVHPIPILPLDGTPSVHPCTQPSTMAVLTNGLGS